MFCSNCGAQLPDGSKFCANCGASQSAAPAGGSAFKPAPMSFEEQVKEVPVKVEVPDAVEVPAPVVEAAPAPAPEQIPEPVAVPAPEMSAPAQEKPAKAKKAKKKGKKLPIILAAVVLVLALVAVGAWFLFGGKAELPGGAEPVYLLTQQRIASNDGENEVVTSYVYDDNGVLQSYEVRENDNVTCYTFRYNDDGQLDKVSVEKPGETVELTYTYDDGVLERIDGESSLGFVYEAKCDSDGKVETVTASYGDSVITTAYTYGSDGNLEKSHRTGGLYEYINTYGESGKLEREEIRKDGQLVSATTYTYDEDGRMIGTSDTSYNATIEVEWKLDDEGYVTDPKLTLREEDSGVEVEFICQTELEDGVSIITVEDVDAPGQGEDELEEIMEQMRDYTVEVSYTDFGRVASVVVDVDNHGSHTTYEEYSYTYQETDLGEDYVPVNINDPVWGTFVG